MTFNIKISLTSQISKVTYLKITSMKRLDLRIIWRLIMQVNNSRIKGLDIAGFLMNTFIHAKMTNNGLQRFYIDDGIALKYM